MDEIEIIHTAIPLEHYELKITQLINALLIIDDKMFTAKTQNPILKEAS